MEFKGAQLQKITNNEFLISWTYKEEFIPSPMNYLIRISVGSSPEPPFQFLEEIPYNDTSYTYNIKSHGAQTFFFEVALFNIYTKEIESKVIVTEVFEYNPIVEKLKSKYKVLINKKVKNPALFFKRKKVGYRCRKCWSLVENRVLIDSCDVCFETSYGNNSLPKQQDLYLDGLLKLGADGKLTFYKQSYTFNYYRLPGQSAEVKAGDEFRVEDLEGNILLTTKIIEVHTDYLILDTIDTTVMKYIENAKYSIYSQMDVGLEGIKPLCVYEKGTQATLFNLPACVEVEYGGEIFTVESTSFGNLVVSGDLDKLQEYHSKMTLLDSDGSIISIIDIEGILWSTYDASLQYMKVFLPDELPLEENASLYIRYEYNGISQEKINSKITHISESDVAGDSLALAKYIGSGIFEIQTLSNYESFKDSPEIVYERQLYNFLKNVEDVTFRDSKYCLALEQLEVQLEPYTKLKLPHSNIKKDSFRGCGVLLINLKTGNTYRGQNWDGDTNEYTDDGDFFVNPDTGEFSSRDIPKGTYEIKYVYETKDIRFKNIFLPMGVTFKNGELEDTNHWVFRHESLVGADIDTNSFILAIGRYPSYAELTIDRFFPETGKLVVNNPNTLPKILWGSVVPKTKFSVDYKHTGGYYTSQKGMINYLQYSTKNEEAGVTGVDLTDSPKVFITSEIAIDPGDLIYDSVKKVFFVVVNITMNVFKGQITGQIVQLSRVSYGQVNTLKKLLDR